MSSPTVTLSPPAAAGTDTTGRTDIVGNDEFLRAVFGDPATDCRPLIVSFPGQPGKAPSKAWFGQPWMAVDRVIDAVLVATANNYFSLATFRPDEAGQYRRQKARFSVLHAVMLDHVGTKVAMERLTLSPTWLLETSAGNYQAGYLLREPVADGAAADRLMNAVVAAGLLRVDQRQQGKRSHRRKANPQVERPESRRPRPAVTDPNPPVGLLQSCPTFSARPSRFASSKQPLVTGSRPGAGARDRSHCDGDLVDHVIPHVPVRQLALSLPIALRPLLATKPHLVTPVLQLMPPVLARHLDPVARRHHALGIVAAGVQQRMTAPASRSSRR